MTQTNISTVVRKVVKIRWIDRLSHFYAPNSILLQQNWAFIIQEKSVKKDRTA